MTLPRYAVSILSAAALLSTAAVYTGSVAAGRTPVRATAGTAAVTPLKEASSTSSTTRPTRTPASREPPTARVGGSSTCAAQVTRC